MRRLEHPGLIAVPSSRIRGGGQRDGKQEMMVLASEGTARFCPWAWERGGGEDELS